MHHRAGASARRGGEKKGLKIKRSAARARPEHQDPYGRSRPGLPVRFTLTAGQKGDAPQAAALIEGLPAEAVMADTAYDADLLRQAIDAKGAIADGPINGRAFQAYIDQLLVPELKPGDGVIMGQPHQGQPRIAQGRRHTRCLSRRPARSCSISRPTVPTSIRSRTLSPSSRRSCEKPHSAPSKDSGPKSPNCRLPLATPMRKPLRRRRIRSNLRGFRSNHDVSVRGWSVSGGAMRHESQLRVDGVRRVSLIRRGSPVSRRMAPACGDEYPSRRRVSSQKQLLHSATAN